MTFLFFNYAGGEGEITKVYSAQAAIKQASSVLFEYQTPLAFLAIGVLTYTFYHIKKTNLAARFLIVAERGRFELPRRVAPT